MHLNRTVLYSSFHDNKIFNHPYMCYSESRKRTGSSESGGGVVRKKKALSVSADDPE